MKKLYLLLFCSAFFCFQNMYSQGSPDYNGGMKVTLDEEGKKYFRVISWVQAQAAYSDDVPATTSNTSFNLRRARVLLFTQINSKFLIVTHFGLNSLNSSALSPTGTGSGSQVFMLDAWVQYNLNKNLSVGAGLHYFNGISRLNNQSTLNTMTLDNNRQSWATLGLTDQFGRHIGIFAKGNLGKLQYRLAINDVLVNGLDARDPNDIVNSNTTIYGGRKFLGSKDSGKAYVGYFDFHFLDQESNFLPYKVGSYLGGKKVFNIGAGFFLQPNGSVRMEGSELVGEDVNIFAVDAFYDTPLGDDGSALTAYAVYQTNDYGKDYLFSVYGTGSMIFAHLGYVLAGDKTKTRYQPYVSYGSNSYDVVSNDKNIFGLGANAYFSGHNSKLTLEYKNQKFGDSKTGTVTLQAMIYL